MCVVSPILNCRNALSPFLDQGIILHTRVGGKTNKTEAAPHCIYPYLFTRYRLDTGTEEERRTFRDLFPKEVEVWAKVTVSNGDKIYAADFVKDLPDRQDATFVRVRRPPSLAGSPILTLFTVFAPGRQDATPSSRGPPI